MADMQHLINLLRHGETYIVNDSDNNYQVNRPPTSNSIKAANLLEQFIGELNHKNAILVQLTQERDVAYQEIERLRSLLGAK
jgi:hypothetical protein